MPPKRKRDDPDGSDDEDMSFGRQILPVANLPENFEGDPEDGMQYLFTVRRDARHLPHVTRVPNPYEIPERPPHPPSDNLPSVHPALPSPEWRTLFETRCRNFRKNIAQPTIHVHQPARRDSSKLIPDLKERDLWWAFLSGRPAAEWDIPKKPKQRFQRGMRAFADDPAMDAHSVGSSRDDALEMRPMNDDAEAGPQLPTPSGTPAPTDLTAAEHAQEPLAEGGMPIYKPREPTPSLLRLIDQRMALHLLMYFTHWTNLHLQPEKLCRVTQAHARWIFALLSRVEDYISADDMHLLRNLARTYLALLEDLTRSNSKERVSEEDINPESCWLIIATVVGIWGQRDLWMDAEEMIRRPK
ncbi:hypothetical protein B0H17DRAFT_1204727 [Mycena rosella]|uniref:Uncharacterized protein n=1 Tax=Mycena rosella TaxID=1033263 RepID=A0AAD7D8D3_MYCRO|nr:hypothetical protein B0H17DRAFT_1204727 [Mycena rosella]